MRLVWRSETLFVVEIVEAGGCGEYPGHHETDDEHHEAELMEFASLGRLWSWVRGPLVVDVLSLGSRRRVRRLFRRYGKRSGHLLLARPGHFGCRSLVAHLLEVAVSALAWAVVRSTVTPLGYLGNPLRCGGNVNCVSNAPQTGRTNRLTG